MNIKGKLYSVAAAFQESVFDNLLSVNALVMIKFPSISIRNATV